MNIMPCSNIHSSKFVLYEPVDKTLSPTAKKLQVTNTLAYRSRIVDIAIKCFINFSPGLFKKVFAAERNNNRYKARHLRQGKEKATG
jgi:hypothetical protein